MNSLPNYSYNNNNRQKQMSLQYAAFQVAAIGEYVLPVRHSYDTRLRRKMDAAVWSEWPVRATEVAAAIERCRLSLWRFHLLCAEYEGLLDQDDGEDESGDDDDEDDEDDDERFVRGYSDVMCGIAREMQPHGAFLSAIPAWSDLLRATENYATWAFCLAERSGVVLPRFG
jgi:hypothetical protein